jgi:hypothetical protein
VPLARQAIENGNKVRIRVLRGGGVIAPANFHFLASLFYLESEKVWTKDFAYSKLNVQIKKVIKIIRNKHGQETTYLAIFTKYDETWIELKKYWIKMY